MRTLLVVFLLITTHASWDSVPEEFTDPVGSLGSGSGQRGWELVQSLPVRPLMVNKVATEAETCEKGTEA